MTLAAAALTPNQPSVSQAVPIIILGTDALLAATPATPVQLAHACLRAGFASVVPASWGDEIVAASVMRHLPRFGTGPAIQCSCPFVAHRLLTVGGDLRPVLLPLVSPPVALARYLRAVSQPTPVRVTYVGECPGAADVSIDVRMTPSALIDMLAERQIVIAEQPRVFEAFIPPDRRRFRSQPGGLPAADLLWNELGARSILEVDSDDFVQDVAQQVLGGKNVLIDVSARLGCVCAGAVQGASPRDARAAVVALEPPRAGTPVVEEQIPIELDLPVPVASRSPLDVVAVSPSHAGRETVAPALTPPAPVATPIPTAASAGASEMSFGHSISPVHGFTAVADLRLARTSNPITPRAVLPASPPKDAAKKKLPRAFVARRRSSPKGISAVSPPDEEPAQHASARTSQKLERETPSRSQPSAQSPALEQSRSTPWRMGPRQLIYIAIAVVMLVLAMSTIVGVIVGRSIASH